MPDKENVEEQQETAADDAGDKSKRKAPKRQGSKGRFAGLGTPRNGSQRDSKKAEAQNKAYMTNIDDRLTKAVENAKEQKNRSPDLVGLSKEFDNMRKQLRTLIVSTKKYNEAYIQSETARAEMINEMAKLSEGSPLYDDVGKTKNDESLAHINQAAAKEAKESAIDFHKKVVDYATEWESIVTTRIDDKLRDCKKLGQDRSHYEGKVDKLRQDINKTENSGREAPESKMEKLKRNEEKLKEAFEKHEELAGKTCVLIEEVVQSGWKDLYPLIKSTMNWEVNRVKNEAEIFSEIPEALDRLVITYKANRKK